MKKVATLFLLLLCFTAYQVDAQIQWDAARFMPLDEVEPGMRGTGYTVFSGTTVEPFDFEVVSIQYNRYPRQHIIWAKGLSENFTYTGSAGGMSGSPVYIDGRLAGALARSHRDQRRYANIFGITPIASMIAVTERTLKPNPEFRGARLFRLDTGIATEGIDTVSALFHTTDHRPADRHRQDEHRWTAAAQTLADSERLAIPLALPGIDAETLRHYMPIFEALNLMPVAAAAGAAAPEKKTPIEAGQTIGVASARGDYTAFGFGTLTYIQDDQFIAYGHARDDAGHVNLPVSGGYVHHIVPARYRSYKVASATQLIGTLAQDRDAAIAGTIGEHPSYLPIKLSLKTTDGKQHDLAYEVVRHRGLSALYAELGTAYLIEALDFADAEHTLAIDAEFRLKPDPLLSTHRITAKNVYTSESTATGVRQMLRAPLLQLVQNRYRELEIAEIQLNLTLEPKRRSAVIESLRVDRNRYRPGEEVTVILTLRPYLENRITHRATITIPDDTPEGVITLLAMSATADSRWQRSRAPLNFQPKTINQLLRLLQQTESNTAIVCELFRPDPGLTVQGEEFADLPPSVSAVMKTPKQIGETGWTRGTTLQRETVSTPYVISGSGDLEIVVDSGSF